MKKILIADDHALVRNGIVNSISNKLPDVLFGEASNASEALEKLHAEDWDLLILDINMPGRDGLDLLKEVKIQYPGIPVIFLSMFPEDQYALRTLKAGASAYLSKDTSTDELVKAVNIVLNGEKYITSTITSLLTEEYTGACHHSSHEMLSDREFQVFKMIASGMNISGIGIELCLSVKTISVYRAHILKKMGLKNNAEITYYAFKHNLVV